MKNIFNLKDYDIVADALVHKKTGEVIAFGIYSTKDKNHPLYGKEIPDPRPCRARLKIKAKPTEAERIAMQVAMQLKNHNIQQDEQHQETFAEAEDFNIPDEPIEPGSPWEENFDNLEDNHHELVADQEVNLGVRAPGHKPSEVQQDLQKQWQTQQQQEAHAAAIQNASKPAETPESTEQGSETD